MWNWASFQKTLRLIEFWWQLSGRDHSRDSCEWHCYSLSCVFFTERVLYPAWFTHAVCVVLALTSLKELCRSGHGTSRAGPLALKKVNGTFPPLLSRPLLWSHKQDYCITAVQTSLFYTLGYTYVWNQFKKRFHVLTQTNNKQLQHLF